MDPRERKRPPLEGHQRKRASYPLGFARVSGLLPRIIVWTRSGSRDWRDRWIQTVRALGLQYAEITREGEGKYRYDQPWTTVYDVWGTPLALQELTQPGKYPVVSRWEYFIHYRGPRPTDSGAIPVGQGTGTGPPAPKRGPTPVGMSPQEYQKTLNRPLS